MFCTGKRSQFKTSDIGKPVDLVIKQMNPAPSMKALSPRFEITLTRRPSCNAIGFSQFIPVLTVLLSVVFTTINPSQFYSLAL
jgi:hypothetical protein